VAFVASYTKHSLDKLLFIYSTYLCIVVLISAAYYKPDTLDWDQKLKAKRIYSMYSRSSDFDLSFVMQSVLGDLVGFKKFPSVRNIESSKSDL